MHFNETDLLLPEVELREVQEEDAEALLEFELENRDFFEKWVPARSPDYFEVQALKQIIAVLSEENSSYFLVWAKSQKLAGRINLRLTSPQTPHIAEVGYRIAEAFTGKGYAKAAVEALLR